MACHPDSIVRDLDSLSSVPAEGLQSIQTFASLQRTTSLCSIPVWHDEKHAALYRAFQRIAYFNFEAPVLLIDGVLQQHLVAGVSFAICVCL